VEDKRIGARSILLEAYRNDRPYDSEGGCDARAGAPLLQRSSTAWISRCLHQLNLVPLVAGLLEGSQVRVCSVVGFPLGAVPAVVKAAEAEAAIEAGAHEIDMVIHIGPLKEGRSDEVLADIAAVCAACRGAVLKVIIEAGLLTDVKKREACRLSVQAGADFVKTSTGFSSGGATVDDVALMRGVVGPRLGVKASGGIRTVQAALEMTEAGANRIGTS